MKLKTNALFVFVGLALALLPSLYYNRLTYGNPFTLAGTVEQVKEISLDSKLNEKGPSYTRNNRQSISGFFDINKLPLSLSVLISSKDRGLVWFSPVILISIIGLTAYRKKHKFVIYTILGVIVSIFSLYGMWGDPWGGWSFGSRYMIPAYSLMSILAGVAINKYKRNILFMLTFILLFSYSVFVNLTGALTTFQIPPSVEADSVKYPDPTFLYNYELVLNDRSSSYLYNYHLHKFVDLKQVFWSLFSIVILITFFFYIKSMIHKEETI